MLEHICVLDLADEKGSLCGRVLGDMGAEVIKVEKSNGDPARRLGPFYHDDPNPEMSLHWWALNGNKKGITLDITKSAGREIFRRLAQKADFVVESFSPGYLEQLGLGYSGLKEENPRIIVASITPFGQEGPYKDFIGPDIIIQSLGGMLDLCGDPDRPPVRISFPQAYFFASLDAVTALLIALYNRNQCGEGQYIDVSAQESVVWNTWASLYYWEMLREIPRRVGLKQQITSVALRQFHWPCKDGTVAFSLFGGALGANIANNENIVAWMDSKGMAPDYLKKYNWRALDFSTISQDELDRLEEPIGRFFLTLTKEEFFKGMRERQILGAPLCTSKDIVKDPHLKARNFWKEVNHPELGINVTYPGFVLPSPSKRAPLIGEHNEDIYIGKLNLSKGDLVMLKEEGII